MFVDLPIKHGDVPVRKLIIIPMQHHPAQVDAPAVAGMPPESLAVLGLCKGSPHPWTLVTLRNLEIFLGSYQRSCPVTCLGKLYESSPQNVQWA